MQEQSMDFFNQVDANDVAAAAADVRQGGSPNPFEIEVPVVVTIDGDVELNENSGIEETEAVFTISEGDRSYQVALGTAIYLGDKVELYNEAKGVDAAKRTKEQKQTMKFAGISRSKLHNLFAAALPGYETRLLEKVGTKWQATDMDGNPMDKAQREAAETLREAKLNKILAAWQKGEHLGILKGKQVTYVPLENEKNPSFPYHSFRPVNS